MTNKSITIIVAALLIVGIGYFVYDKKQEDLNPTPATSASSESVNSSASSTSEETSLPPSNGIALTEVEAHHTRETCWVAISGSVYDLTSWIPKHPGGEQAILQLCGTNGTAKFTAQHGGNSKVLSVLAGFKISLLAQ